MVWDLNEIFLKRNLYCMKNKSSLQRCIILYYHVTCHCERILKNYINFIQVRNSWKKFQICLLFDDCRILHLFIDQLSPIVKNSEIWLTENIYSNLKTNISLYLYIWNDVEFEIHLW